MNIEHNILEIIERGTTEGNLYFLPKDQLDRKTYLDVNKVLECLGGKWNRKSKAHVFESDISGAIDDVLLTGEVIDKKKEFQFFETPQNIVDQLIKLAEVQPGHRCLEPSAGRGNIAEALSELVGIGMVTCIELNPENVEILVNKGFFTKYADFLEYTTESKYDRIVMNPPFTRQQDIAHVQKALPLLANGGILVSVMSTGITFRQDNKTLSFLAKLKEYEVKFVDLSQGAFKVAGTMVNTLILKVVSMN